MGSVNTITKPRATTNTTLAETLDRLTAWINRYSVHLTDHEARVMALWAAHTWVVTCFYVTPRLIFSSATPQSGKTRQLELLENVTYAPRRTENTTPAVLFRSIERGYDNGAPPTILFDETDAMFNGKGDGKQEELRGLVNSGYKQGGRVDRCVGDGNEIKTFRTYAPVALAGIAGNMPDTITTRAITIEMRKRKPGERIAPYQIRTAEGEATPFKEFFEQWSSSDEMKDYLAACEPELPPGVEDRPAEIWSPLVAIADMAGAQWGTYAREACAYFVTKPGMEERPKGVQLLEDIRTVMDGREFISSRDLCDGLNCLEDGQWQHMGREGIAPAQVSRMLRPFMVKPVKIREGGTTFRGFSIHSTFQEGGQQVGLNDAWDRYLAPLVPETRNTRNSRNTAGQEGEKCSTPAPSSEQHPEHATPQEPIEGDLAILDEMNPGDAINYRALATQINHDEQEVHEALERLTAAGFVTTPNNKLYKRN